MRTYLVVLLMILATAGCAHRREAAAIQRNGAACEQLGHVGGTPAWSACAASLDKYRRTKGGEEFEMPTVSDPSRKMTCAYRDGATACK